MAAAAKKTEAQPAEQAPAPVAAAAPAPAPVVQLKRLPLGSDRFVIRESSFVYPEVDVTMPIGHTLEDALHPEYWSNHAHLLRRNQMTHADRTGALLILRTEDHRFKATLYVVAILEGGFSVVLDGPVTEIHKGKAESERHFTRYNQLKGGFDIIRKSDHVIVGDASRFKTLPSAEAEIRNLEAS